MHGEIQDKKNKALTLSSGLALSFGSKKLLPLSGPHLIVFNLLPAQALDLLEKLGYFVRHGGIDDSTGA